MKPLADCRLYTFIDSAYLAGRRAEEIAAQLCEGGSDLIQLRAKNRDPEQVRSLALGILPITRAAGVGLVINDHLAVAKTVGADFCHLGQEDFFDSGFHHVSDLPPGSSTVRIGLSTHTPAQAARALSAGADYIAIGPVFSTPTKPSATPVTLDYVTWATANVRTPWFAIGGIHLGNLDAVMAAGAQRICVVSAILKSPDIAGTCREFRKRLDRVP